MRVKELLSIANIRGNDIERELMRENYQEIILGLQSELAAYKIALNYFVKEGGQPAFEIARNLLKEVEG